MARRCAVTGKKPMAGRNTQHRRGGLWFNRAQRTVTRFHPNVQKKYIMIDGQKVKVKISTSALRTMDKHGGKLPPAVAKKLLKQAKKTIFTKKHQVAAGA